VGYWYSKVKKNRLLTGFYVRDWAEGMTREKVEEAYEQYGADTAAEARSGAIGVGAKDALYGMEACHVITVRDGIPVVLGVRTVEEDIDIKFYDAPEKQIAEANKNLKRVRAIDVSKNGTIVLFKIPSEGNHPRFERFKERLQNYYTLRNILGDKSRRVRLVDVQTGNSHILKHNPPKGVTEYDNSFDLMHKGDNYSVQVKIKRANKDLDKDKEYGYNLIVQDDRGAILDNTLFNFEDDMYAKKFFGTITINNWRQLYKNDETVLTDNREGLDFVNDFNKELRARIRYILNSLIDSEKKSIGPRPKISNEIRKRIMEAFSFANKIIESEGGGKEFPSEPQPPPSITELVGLKFSQSLLTLEIGEKREVKLYYNKEQIPLKSKITLIPSHSNLEIEPKVLVTNFETDIEGSLPLRILGIEAMDECTLRAKFNDFEAVLLIKVIPPVVMEPINGFSFTAKEVTMVVGTSKKLRLLTDTRVVKPGTLIKLTSSDSRVSIKKSRLNVSSGNISKFIDQEIVILNGNVTGVTAEIIARVNTSKGELKDTCKVKVIEKERPKNFFTNFQLDREKDGHQRASFERGTVYVHVNSPVLKHYFGDAQELLDLKKDKSGGAIPILADTILQCIAREMAKYFIERGIVHVLSDKETEIERQKNKIEYQYGERIHQMITEASRTSIVGSSSMNINEDTSS
jgi:hypothetical protein